MAIDSILLAGGALAAYSRGLSTISDNIANLNTTAYKGKRLLYEALPGETWPGRGDAGSPSGGVGTQGPHRLYGQGELQQTGASYDFGIAGDGYFLLQDAGQTRYTRAGSFTFDQSGRLVQQASQLAVLAYNSGGQLAPVVLSAAQRVSAGSATTSIAFANILNSGSASYEMPDAIPVYTSAGSAIQVRLGFALNPDVMDEWVVSVKSADATELGTGTIRFLASGNIDPANMQFVLDLGPQDGPSQYVTFDFADTKSYSTLNSTLAVENQDGLSAGQLGAVKVSGTGELVAWYSNGNTQTLGHFALARTNTPDLLTPLEHGLFAADNPRIQLEVAQAGSQGLGTVEQGVLEASNVDLTAGFSELIITQRGYQAASQVITATNEMLGVLFNIRGQQ